MISVTEEELVARSQYPRITPDQIEAVISDKRFVYTGLHVTCILTLTNGFTVTGESGCAVPGNWKKDVGERLAYQNAFNQLWPLLGFELKNKIALVLSHSKPSYAEAKTFVGTKVVHATPMNRGDYNEVRGWAVPDNEDPTDAGFLVEYPDQPSNCEGFLGYVSWSPKAVFEASYEEIDVNGKGAHGGPTWHDRLLVEKSELLDRLDKLTTFIAGPLFEALPSDQKDLLMGQMSAMSSYLAILKLRLGEG